MNSEKPALAIRSEVLYRVVEENSLESLVKQVYGRDFNVCDDLESGNDSVHSFRAQKNNNRQYGLTNLQRFQENGEYHHLTSTLLNDLCDQDLIPEGYCLITICY